MREIFFRGQTRRKGQKVWMDGSPVEGNWVYGGVCHGTGDYSIIYGNLDEERERPTEKWVVYTDTVGQFTGLTDKKGKKVFEGDVCRVSRPCVLAYGKITFQNGCFWFVDDGPGGMLRLCDAKMNGFEIEVIGNIHDNPELLGGVGDGI